MLHRGPAGSRDPTRGVGCASHHTRNPNFGRSASRSLTLKIILVRADGICYMEVSRSSERRQTRWFSCRAGMDLRQDRNCNQR